VGEAGEGGVVEGGLRCLERRSALAAERESEREGQARAGPRAAVAQHRLAERGVRVMC
jgi:hypothetical protein